MSITYYYLLNKEIVRVISSDSTCKDGNGILKSICLIKYELDMNVYNFEHYFIYIVLSLQSD